MKHAVLAGFLVACGSASTEKPIEKPSGPAAPTCADVGVILRGPLHGEDEKVAGRAREAAIADSCVIDRWPPSVIACVAGTAHPAECLDKLDDSQRKAHTDRMDVWSVKYGHDFDGDPDGDDGGDIDMPPPMIACESALGDAGRYGDPLKDDAPERAWNLKVREEVLHHACEDDAWEEDLKTCLTGATTAPEVEECISSKLAVMDQKALTKQLTEVDALAKKIAETKKKPKTFGCKQVVAAHYGDKQWTKKLDAVKGDERKRMIKESRAKMTTACTADAWDDTVRACVIAGGDDTCFKTAGLGLRWGYPATGVVIKIGVPECDAYGETIAKLVACDKIPQASRDSMREAFEQMSAVLIRAPVAERSRVGTSCKAGLQAIEQVLQSSGC